MRQSIKPYIVLHVSVSGARRQVMVSVPVLCNIISSLLNIQRNRLCIKLEPFIKHLFRTGKILVYKGYRVNLARIKFIVSDLRCLLRVQQKATEIRLKNY